jgi:diguanylate cyclase (GGDEF)-like protein/PAS domain S-box-containing protein
MLSVLQRDKHSGDALESVTSFSPDTEAGSVRIYRVFLPWFVQLRLPVLLVWLVSAGMLFAQVPPTATPPAQKGVLVLLSSGFGQRGIDNYVKGLYEVLKEHGVNYRNIHVEYLDLVKNPDDAYGQRLGELLLSKYPESTVGVIVSVQPAALNFLLNAGRAMAPGAPVLVAQANVAPGVDTAGRHFFLQAPSLDFSGTLQRALELFPRTERVVLLSGASPGEQERLQDAKRQFAPWSDRLLFDYVYDLAFEEVKRRLSATPPNTVIIAPGINRDGKGEVFVPLDTIVAIAASANAPVFPVYSVSVGKGAIGGMVSVLEQEGQSMALSVLDALRLEPNQISSLKVHSASSVSLFDWQQIERWNGDASKLPADTVFLNRPPTLWGQYQGYVIGGVLAIVALSLLSAALFVQSRRRLLAERHQRAAQAKYRLLSDNIMDVLWLFNLKKNKWDYMSPSIRHLLGIGAEEAMLQPFDKFIADDASEGLMEVIAKRVAAYRNSSGETHTYTDTNPLKHTNGATVWTETVTRYSRNEQGELALLGVTRDVSQRMLAQQEINKLAFYDALTHLPNRKLFLDRMQQALTASARSRGTGALLFIDLDDFKTLNDTRGHDIGDLLLQQVARRLSDCLREADTVARLGGDEFVVILEGLDESSPQAAAQARVIGEKILAALHHPYRIDDIEHNCSASIGVVLFNGAGESVDELLKRADMAMYRAKSTGRNALCFFDPAMQASVTARAAMESDLRKALLEQQFMLFYQPQVEAGRVTGAEALIRWKHPERGMVSPADFIALAEANGLILPIGAWVLETACAQLVAWAREPITAHLTLAVNVSAIQFRHIEFVTNVLEVLTRTGANPQKLKLELTESLLVNDMEETIVQMMRLKAQGLTFSLDDFGTGYSSLSYLKRLPLDQLKIDQSFVRDVLIDPNDAAIARTIVALAQSLGLGVIAEGVETEAQREFLAGQGCDSYQGYLLSRPLPIGEFEQFMRRG